MPAPPVLRYQVKYLFGDTLHIFKSLLHGLHCFGSWCKTEVGIVEIVALEETEGEPVSFIVKGQKIAGKNRRRENRKTPIRNFQSANSFVRCHYTAGEREDMWTSFMSQHFPAWIKLLIMYAWQTGRFPLWMWDKRCIITHSFLRALYHTCMCTHTSQTHKHTNIQQMKRGSGT